ncbi:conserved hypothetical protein [Trichormus variabilis ATCC 29413]|uniref:Uncharacterized protein n=2 Tax=Anabaena variabilis TaxID=264691 RepID=Q3M4M9_TRIV2|nr:MULTISPECIES: hypothetical protein [Nostocaceae]ABA24057.1 conserved hypothetical protein [Trichormus variabilis ATCC 29413]MBC1213195.1 hypothetical protein [Trichormus variabilis ARAD]MBC1253950.1 hypothetical protein [Trichormus variabilis V5]MBC1266661.1 hypothetical protein [Trichormus variabilis FSR]MBC1300734.1 hypothetical protein [Trichormus variabilis N2B]
MKFSVKSIYPISTPLAATKSPFSWEFGVAGVEYLFMGDGSRDGAQITKGNYDFIIDVSIDGLNSKPQLDSKSGRYRQRYAVPK